MPARPRLEWQVIRVYVLVRAQWEVSDGLCKT
jgi:hypothetical protein